MLSVQTHIFRLKPGEDLKKSIQAFVREKQISAGWIVTCAGSLTGYRLRFSDQQQGNEGQGYFEIVGLTGTLSVNGSHIHMSISDSSGKTIGGHLMEGSIIYSTAEIVIQSSDSLIFKREKDGTTPWEELTIQQK